MADDQEHVDAPVMQSLNPLRPDASPIDPASTIALEAIPTTSGTHSQQLEAAVETGSEKPLEQTLEGFTAEHMKIYEPLLRTVAAASPGQFPDLLAAILKTATSQISAAVRSAEVKSQLPLAVASGSSSGVPSASSIVPVPVVAPIPPSEASSSSVRHIGVSCDVCKMVPIEGTRFRSTRKHDYDLCSNCFKEADDQADYTRIDRPLNHPIHNPVIHINPALLYAPQIQVQNKELNETNDSMCRTILEHLRLNQVVRVVDFNYSTYFGSIESCKILGEVVGSSKTLSVLSLHGVGMDGDGLEHIIRGLLGNPNSALVCLERGSNIKLGKKGAEVVEELLLRNLPKLTNLGIWGPGFSQEDTAPVARALAKNTTLLDLACGVGYGVTSPDCEGPLTSILRAFTPVDMLTPEQASYQDGTYNQTVQTLSINYEYEKGIAENLVTMLRRNASLKVLGLRFFQLTREEWAEVWRALKHNKVVHTMDLYRCGEGLGKAFEDLIALLQVNRTLKRITMGETPLDASGQSALVEEQLERNKRVAGYLGTLNNKLNFEPPKIGRLFLCGYPRAGKTTLRRAMVGTQRNMITRTLISGAACMTKQHCFFPSFFDKRTQGIEIRMLTDSGDKHIAIWDMAGQDEYHALHDSHYMFPDINQACIFLFLFRPAFNEKGIWQEEDSVKSLECELCYWLGFINSNSRKTGSVLPQVSVVLTHLDKVSLKFPGSEEARARSYVTWANAKVDKLRADFAGRVELQTVVHAVDAFSAKHARRVVDDVFERFDALFSNTLPEVPAACEEMNLVLEKWTVRHSSNPIITQEAFFQLCKENVKELNALFEEVPPELANEAQGIRDDFREKNELAVASYLHDVGSIIHFPRSTFVVVDPNWLGKVFLGQLFRPGDATYDPIINGTRNGCVSRENLHNVLEGFIESNNYHGFTSGDLIHLMKELELCYEERLDSSDPSTTTYFIPSTLSDPKNLAREGKRKLEWTVQGGGDVIYDGLRLQCTDQSRTFLSPGFFQRFQVHLQTFLRGLNVQLYEIEKNLIRLTHDGLELLVEKSGDNGLLDGDYVDILAKSYSSSVNGRPHNLYGRVMEELRVFCASREGCPGVALQEAIVRRECVKRLTLCCHRKDQAVVKETLKQKVIEKLFESSELVVWNDDSYENSISETSQIYMHPFPAVPNDPSLPVQWIEAMKMLNLQDVKEAIFKYRTTIGQQRYAIFQAVDDVQSVTGSATRDAPTVPEGQDAPPDGPDSWTYYTNEMERRSQDPLARDLRNAEASILSRIDLAESRIVSRIDQLEKLLLGHIKESLKDMQMLHQKLYSTLVQKLDEVMEFTGELQGFPGMPYFSDREVGSTQRLVAFINIGQPVKLHFMCENPSQPHYIKDQQGLPLINLIQGDIYKKLRPLILGSIKVFFILAKAGLQVAAGIGSVIPDFKSLPGYEAAPALAIGGEILMDNIKRITYENIDGTLADAWGCIQTVMGPIKARGQIAEIFKLHRVQFKSGQLTKYLKKRHCFWLCEECRTRAQQDDLLWPGSETHKARGL